LSRERLCSPEENPFEEGETRVGVDLYFSSTQAGNSIPLIWPQFSGRGPLPSHGFARVSQWTVIQRGPSKLVLELQDSEESRKIWPFGFVVHYTVELLDAALRLDFQVTPKDKDVRCAECTRVTVCLLSFALCVCVCLCVSVCACV
jgi:hypothetical protein